MKLKSAFVLLTAMAMLSALAVVAYADCGMPHDQSTPGMSSGSMTDKPAQSMSPDYQDRSMSGTDKSMSMQHHPGMMEKSSTGAMQPGKPGTMGMTTKSGIQPLMTQNVVRLPLLPGQVRRADLGQLTSAELAKAHGWIQLTYNPHANVTNISGRILGLAPNTTYRIYLYAPGLGWHHGSPFSTYSNGAGGFSDTVSGNHAHHLPVRISGERQQIAFLQSPSRPIG